jgi:hypothetical protein
VDRPTVVAVTAGAGAGKGFPTALRLAVPGLLLVLCRKAEFPVRRRRQPRPAVLDTANEDVDLLTRERAPASSANAICAVPGTPTRSPAHAFG